MGPPEVLNHGKFIRQRFGLFERFFFACSVELTHERLATITDTLQKKINNADDIGDTGIGGDSLLSAIINRKSVDDHKRDIWGKGQAKWSKSDF